MRKVAITVLIIILLSSLTYGLSNTAKIEVLFNSINIKVNGVDVKADNILYKGTTYIPLRAVAEALHRDVQWDSSTKTAHINDISQSKGKNPLVTIKMESGELIQVELYPEKAPNTVKNFIALANKGFYDGLGFHRVVPGFVIQGGDPRGDGTGGPGYRIKGEFMKNGTPNNLMHTRGIISMARSSQYDSAGSQFFIVVQDSHFLNGEYAAFGKVVEGMEVVDKIVLSEKDDRDKPIKKQTIKEITVDTFGQAYGEPLLEK